MATSSQSGALVELQPFDWSRILWGDAPLGLLAEIAIRTAVMFVLAFVVPRVMGRRGVRQLSPFDYVIIIALGSAVGDPMLYADVPLLHGAVILTVVVSLHRLVAEVTERNDKIDAFVTGDAVVVVAEGRVVPAAYRHAQLDREELFGLLGGEGIEHLGQVRRAYVEKTGQLTTFRYDPDEVRPGLRIEPPIGLRRSPETCAGETVSEGAAYACTNCGHVIRLAAGSRVRSCPVCEGKAWEPAAVDARVGPR
jgi:uncharacterized membrane protein YcaP (DUF421 family)